MNIGGVVVQFATVSAAYVCTALRVTRANYLYQSWFTVYQFICDINIFGKKSEHNTHKIYT